MLALVLALATTACSAAWEPDEKTRAEPGQPVALWVDPATCAPLVVNGAHRRPEGNRGSIVRYDDRGRIVDRFVLPKGTHPSAAVVDEPRKRLVVSTALIGAEAVQVSLEARRLADFSLERSFGAAGKVELRFPRLAPTKAATSGEAVLLVDAQGRLYLVAVADSVTGLTAVYATRLLPDGQPDPAWKMGTTPVSTYERTNSGELVAALDAEGRLVIGAGSRLLAQLFRLTPAGTLDETFGARGRLAPGRSTSALALTTAANGTIHYAARSHGQALVSVNPAGEPQPPITWQHHEDRTEYPFGVALLADGRRLVAARSYLHAEKRGSLVFALWRSDGRLDSGFGTDGLLEVDEPGIDFQGRALELVPNHQVFVAALRARAGEPFDGTIALLRLSLGNGPAAPVVPTPDARPAEPQPTRPPLRGGPVKPAAPPGPVPQAPAPPAEETGVWMYTDESGVPTYVDSLDRVPPKARSKATKLSP